MSKTIRIRTTPGGGNHYLKVNLEQDFDILEILSLKLTQEDVYRQFYSDYGVVVGRVFCNGGLGIPNAKVSIFVPLDPNERSDIKELYPYRTAISKNEEGIRYNLLPNLNQNDCHVPVGTFPSKRELLDNDLELEVFDKYYKYTTTTNDAGDYMIFGVPVGNHVVNVDVDLSDVGKFSQKPYDLIEQGNPQALFKSTTQFKGGKDINNLTQIKTQQIGVNVMPFWGEKKQDEVGISRVDVDLNYDIKPKAIFIGNVFSDNEKNSINKNCQTSKKAGKVCEMTPVDGFLHMIRKRQDGAVENYSVQGGDVVDNDGTWVFQIPMNLDYMITDEFGKLIPTEEPNKGIPTRTRVRFKLDPMNTGEEGRLRTRASYLIPHNPKNSGEIDYEFGGKTKDISFRDLYWNKIYTVKNFIPRFQNNSRLNSRKFVGLKDVDDCSGNKNPLPFNRMDKDFNPLFTVLCFIMEILITIIGIVNSIISVHFWDDLRLPGGRVFCGNIDCITIKCNGKTYSPNCRCKDGGEIRDNSETRTCFQNTLAEALNVYEFDFYNDWLNGSLYSVLLKYKSKRNGSKFCDVDDSSNTHLHDTLVGDVFGDDGHRSISIKEGIVKKYNDELFYAPITKNGQYKLLSTDIVSLGTISNMDWQGQPSLHTHIPASTYKIPPFMYDADDDANTTPMADYEISDNRKDGLLFNLTCVEVSVNRDQARNIKRLCEIGVGLDEDRFDEPDGKGSDRKILDDDIDNRFSRDAFILLNDPNVTTLPKTGLKSGFEGSDYKNFRDYNTLMIPQPMNSLYFYFGTQPNKTAIEKMNKKYFESCVLDTNKSYGDDTQ